MKNKKIDYRKICICLLPILILTVFINIFISQNIYYKFYQDDLRYRNYVKTSELESVDADFLVPYDTKYSDDGFIIEYNNNTDDIGISPSAIIK